MSGAKNIECRCDSRMTCGYCMRNAKPWFYTLSDGSAIAVIPVQKYTPTREDDEAQAAWEGR